MRGRGVALWGEEEEDGGGGGAAEGGGGGGGGGDSRVEWRPEFSATIRTNMGLRSLERYLFVAETNLRSYRGRLAPSPTGFLHLGHAGHFGSRPGARLSSVAS